MKVCNVEHFQSGIVTARSQIITNNSHNSVGLAETVYVSVKVSEGRTQAEHKERE
jgi:hypothetical protein